MKIRIKGNTLRLRLTQTEVEQFAASGKVEEQIVFGPSKQDQLKYSLENSDGDTIHAVYLPGKIVVKVPKELGQHWAKSTEVGMSALLPLKDNDQLSILIEKDFQCMKARVGEDESDNFPNPEVK